MRPTTTATSASTAEMQHTQKMIGKASANPKFEELDDVSAFCASGIMARQQGMRQMATGTPIAMVNDIGACQSSSTIVALLVALKIDAAAIVAGVGNNRG